MLGGIAPVKLHIVVCYDVLSSYLEFVILQISYAYFEVRNVIPSKRVFDYK